MQACASATLACHICGETFRRREHLDRHRARHTGAKPFTCPVCNKAFTRSDTLVRHRALHGEQEASVHGRRGPRIQACQSCAQLKQRCDGKKPCSRCSLRNAACTYLSNCIPSSLSCEPVSPSGALNRESADGSLHHASDLHQDGNLSFSVSESSVAAALHSSDACLRTSACYGSNGICFCSNCTIGSIASDSPSTWTASAVSFPFPWPLYSWNMSLDDGSFLDLPKLNESSVGVTASAEGIPSATHVPQNTQSSSVLTRNTISTQYLAQENICGGYTTSCVEFPVGSQSNIQVAESEVYGNISSIPQPAVDGLHKFYLTQQTNNTPTQILPFFLHTFTELYFEHFDWQFPCVHRSQLEATDLSWVLLLATAAVGSQYSKVSDASRYQTALADLLARAIEFKVSKGKAVDIQLTQSAFLLHVLWKFSGSRKDKVVLQHKRSTLLDLCCDLLGQSRALHDHDPHATSPDQIWRSWLVKEEVNRVTACAQALESMGCLFLDTPPIPSLRAHMRQWPSSDNLWLCSNASQWHALRKSNSNRGDVDHFATRVFQLELFINQKNLVRQLQAYKDIRAHVGSSFSDSAVLQRASSSHGVSAQADFSRLDSVAVELQPREDECATLDALLYEANRKSDTILHVLAILRRVSLEMLHSATGWQTTTSHKLRSKAKFCDFIAKNGAAARKCLLHAYRIFQTTRGLTLGASYDVFSLMVAVAYIYCFAELCTGESSIPDAPDQGTKSHLVRLDQLRDNNSIDDWINNNTKSAVLISGVGLLNGPDACVRLLRDVEQTLLSQVAWSGICRAFAGSFAQLRRGETPTRKSGDPAEQSQGL